MSFILGYVYFCSLPLLCFPSYLPPFLSLSISTWHIIHYQKMSTKGHEPGYALEYHLINLHSCVLGGKSVSICLFLNPPTEGKLANISHRTREEKRKRSDRKKIRSVTFYHFMYVKHTQAHTSGQRHDPPSLAVCLLTTGQAAGVTDVTASERMCRNTETICFILEVSPSSVY